MSGVSRKKPGAAVTIGILIILLTLSVFGWAYSFYFGNKEPHNNSSDKKTDFFAPSRFNLDSLPQDKQGKMIRYGYHLVAHTSSIIGPDVRNPVMRFAGNNLACQNCHIDSGQRKFAAPFVGVTGRFPQFRKRADALGTIEDRINGCMQRSMNGKKLPADSREMKAIVAYMTWLSRGVPVGEKVSGTGYVKLHYPDRKASIVNGKKIFLSTCTSCHGENGQGKKNDPNDPTKGYLYPPLWGPDSFNRGAGMHRVLKAAAFIKANMPFGTTYKKPVLTDAEAYDVAAYINSKTRPGLAHLDKDFPILTLKPVDCPYPPYADHFTQEQHQYGPFQPIIKADKKRSKSSK